MRIRHRVPSIFNLSMVDVLCCALGCVILLWLLNLRQAKDKTAEAGQTEQRLTETTDRLTATTAERDQLRGRLATTLEERDQLSRRLAATAKERDQWHSNLDEATAQLSDLASQARKRQAQLDEMAAQLTETQKRLAATQEAAHSTALTLGQTEGDRDKARAEMAQLNKALAALRAEKKDVEERLAQRARDYGDLDKQMTATAQRVVTLESQLRDKGNLAESNGQRADGLATQLTEAQAQVRKLQALADTNAERAEGLATRLSDAEIRGRTLQTQADLVPGLQIDVKANREKYATAAALARALEKELTERIKAVADAEKKVKDLREAKEGVEKELAVRIKTLGLVQDDRGQLSDRLALLNKEMAARTKDLSEANARMLLLQSDANALRNESVRLRTAADNRFAGITLTGQRVVFLVDMSGSMELVDEKTSAPEKWRGVRETLVKILRSLPDLKQFQVIVFAEKAWYLLGQEGHWIDYDARTSADQVNDALARLKPQGGTDMYRGLKEAFGFRPEGLDTVYLFSDGLPNVGEVLTPEQVRTLTEEQKGAILGKQIRQALRTEWNPHTSLRPQVRINTIGFFFESPDVGAFLWALARENDGSFVGMSKP